ncbi:hypothetical protein K504DRAFT_172102 [Pleomassaria siparia CBS 279.74]|uniref:Uncharacterized protein n=1 Tax=Pleomassaria siparia CBS 279.74 TaxID=1314801 RepID=A0A6G1JUC1_9PLEO|nr:hypothetical protein K504DRAFT_172102 [Pleomassaria siparia CBS 279.74]
MLCLSCTHTWAHVLTHGLMYSHMGSCTRTWTHVHLHVCTTWPTCRAHPMHSSSPLCRRGAVIHHVGSPMYVRTRPCTPPTYHVRLVNGCCTPIPSLEACLVLE